MNNKLQLTIKGTKINLYSLAYSAAGYIACSHDEIESLSPGGLFECELSDETSVESLHIFVGEQGASFVQDIDRLKPPVYRVVFRQIDRDGNLIDVPPVNSLLRSAFDMYGTKHGFNIYG